MKYALTFISFLVLSLTLQAQEFRSKQDESTMKISGTSTLHDWHIDVESFTAKASLNGENIESAEFKAVVKSLKSGTSSMDDNTYEALDAENYPTINFKSTSKVGADGKVNIKGNLTIAGTTKPIAIAATIEKWSEKSMTVKGKHTFKMTDFGIDPPRAVFGTIRTGDEITIEFKIVLYKD